MNSPRLRTGAFLFYNEGMKKRTRTTARVRNTLSNFMKPRKRKRRVGRPRKYHRVPKHIRIMRRRRALQRRGFGGLKKFKSKGLKIFSREKIGKRFFVIAQLPTILGGDKKVARLVPLTFRKKPTKFMIEKAVEKRRKEMPEEWYHV